MNQPLPNNSNSLVKTSEPKKPLGQLLSEAGLITAQQIETALIDQLLHNPDTRIGQILASKGWIEQQTADFFVEQWHELLHSQPKKPLVYYFRQAGLLSETQINEILVERNQNQAKIRFHHLAVKKGWIKQETVDFFVKNLLASGKKQQALNSNAFATPYELLKNYIRGETNFQRSQLKKIKLNHVTLKGVNLNHSDLTSAELTQANLSNSSLRVVNLTQANLEKAILKEVDFTNACSIGVNFIDAHLEGSNFSQANLQSADLRDAYCVNACFSGADLRGAKLQGANLEGASYDPATYFDADFNPTEMGMRLV